MKLMTRVSRDLKNGNTRMSDYLAKKGDVLRSLFDGREQAATAIANDLAEGGSGISQPAPDAPNATTHELLHDKPSLVASMAERVAPQSSIASKQQNGAPGRMPELAEPSEVQAKTDRISPWASEPMGQTDDKAARRAALSQRVTEKAQERLDRETARRMQAATRKISQAVEME